MTPKKPAEDQNAKAIAVVPAVSGASTTPDVALIHGVTPDGEGLQILRARGDRLEVGAIRPLREGVPITGEVVTLKPRPNFPALCDVETHFKPVTDDGGERRELELAAAPRTGPAQVATDEYRRNWDVIWNQSAAKSKLMN